MKIKNFTKIIFKKIFPEKVKRNSHTGLLVHIKKLGIVPDTILDIGAAQGSFTRECLKIFPDSQYILVEPLDENQNFLLKLASENDNIHIYKGVISSFNGKINLNVHEHLDGSSIMSETDGEFANGHPRLVESLTLDSLIDKFPFAKSNYLIKLDIQGAELEALKGGAETLKKTEYILMEVSFFQFFKNGPQFCDVINFMKSRGFVPYDITGLRYRPYDNALAQADVAFVKENGIFRQYHGFATVEQRIKMVEDFKKKFIK